MEVIKSDEYEELTLEWQYALICLLKDKLLEKGVSSALAKEITSNFIFDLSMLHDQGSLVFQNTSYKPKICFQAADNQNLLLLADESTDLHDYAFGSTDEAFEG